MLTNRRFQNSIKGHFYFRLVVVVNRSAGRTAHTLTIQSVSTHLQLKVKVLFRYTILLSCRNANTEIWASTVSTRTPSLWPGSSFLSSPKCLQRPENWLNYSMPFRPLSKLLAVQYEGPVLRNCTYFFLLARIVSLLEQFYARYCYWGVK